MAEYLPEKKNIIDEKNRYTGLLTRTAEMSDSLMDAIGREDMTEVNRVLSARQELCVQIENSISALGQLIKSYDDKSALSDIRTETEALEETVLKKQSESVKMLSDKLTEYRSALTDLRKSRKVTAAYKNTNRERVPAFLDIKS